MTRKKNINEKNQIVSISILPYQLIFLETHPTFNLSKFVQLALQEQINLYKEVERIEKEVNLNVREPIE